MASPSNLHARLEDERKMAGSTKGNLTFAFMMADWGAEVVDCGTAMLSMHSPYDLLSKADAYETYLAYKAFFESK